jgi:hypothetical protein
MAMTKNREGAKGNCSREGRVFEEYCVQIGSDGLQAANSEIAVKSRMCRKERACRFKKDIFQFLKFLIDVSPMLGPNVGDRLFKKTVVIRKLLVLQLQRRVVVVSINAETI